jgi:hypothetical protein
VQFSSTIAAMAAVYAKQSQRSSAAHVAGWPGSMEGSTRAGQPPSQVGALLDRVDLSDEARSLVRLAPDDPRTVRPALMDDLQDRLLSMMLERLTGHRSPRDRARYPDATADVLGGSAELYGMPRIARYGPGSFLTEMAAITAQSKSARFSADAFLQTSDGQQIDLAVQLSMARTGLGMSFSGAGARDTHFVDPLVLAFQGSAAQVTQTDFRFQLGVEWSGVTGRPFDFEADQGRSRGPVQWVDNLGQRRERPASETGREPGPLTAFAASNHTTERAFLGAVSDRISQTRAPGASEPASELATEAGLEESATTRRGAADAWNQVLINRSARGHDGERDTSVQRWVA